MTVFITEFAWLFYLPRMLFFFKSIWFDILYLLISFNIHIPRSYTKLVYYIYFVDGTGLSILYVRAAVIIDHIIILFFL